MNYPHRIFLKFFARGIRPGFGECLLANIHSQSGRIFEISTHRIFLDRYN